MKNVALFAMVLLLALILVLSGNQSLLNTRDLNPAGDYSGGLLKGDLNSYQKVSNYNLKVKFDPAAKYIYVEEDILWKNATSYATGELQFHLYANAYKSNKTIFAGYFPLTEEAKTEIEIASLSVDGKPAQFIFFCPEIDNSSDSTTAKILLSKNVNPSDSVRIKIEYKMKIPRSVKRLGYATGRNFFFISQWFPKLGVFEEGKWICSQYHPYLDFYSDYGDYDVAIETPKEYIVGATGFKAEKEEKAGKINYRFVQKGVHDFAWFASDEILYRTKLFTRGDGTQILINAFVQPEKEKYFNRYFDAVENSFRFFEENIGIYPYNTITLVDVPRTCAAGRISYPGLFTVNAELFSPVDTHQPEGITIQGVAHQFFNGLMANNEVYEAWLDEGFSSYLTEKILYKYYGKEMVSFRLAGYIPLNGMNLHSLSQIPVVYSVTSITAEEGVEALENYYKNITIGSIADTSYKLPDRNSYMINSFYKPVIALLSMDRYLGNAGMMKILKEYFTAYRFRHPKGKDFYSTVKKFSNTDMDWFLKNFFQNSFSFDYKINSINKKSSTDYEILAERAGDGIAQNDIALYTDKDTLWQCWDGKERWKVFRFKTSNEVLAAEIDPHRRNLLDLNFANNSLTVKPRYGAAISLAMRWFFWVQYALMTLGGIG